MGKPKLLIVDDDQGIRSQLQWGIEGFDIATADSRENAIKQLELHQPHVVTLDLGLPPDVDGTSEGFAILDALLTRQPDLKVIVVSASDKTVNSVKALESGAFEFYPKPVDISSLQEVLDRALAAIE